jgi:homoserine dehydrogenase
MGKKMRKHGVSVGIIGLGTVGAGVIHILSKKSRALDRRLGFPVVIGRVADIDVRRKKKFRLPGNLFVADAEEVINDPDIDIVVELIGGIRPAREYILKAIKRGKHVVTANKLLLATRGMEIFEAARLNNVEIGFEAAVAGGIPIIKILRESLIGNSISGIYGIINGTSNYILTKMTEEGVDFSTALKEAQALGYAEADPTFDVEGVDSAHKLALLASLSFGIPLSFKKVFTEGITRITPLDITFASELGYKIKLLSITKLTDGEIELRVHPTMIPKEHLISSVSGVFNAVYVEGDAVGSALYYGKGAGEMPTGSAVVSDIVDIARDIKTGTVNRIRGIGMPKESSLQIKDMKDVRSRYYLRMSAVEKPGVLSKISGILGCNNISIRSVIQKGRDRERVVPVVMMTHEAREKDMIRALKEINKLTLVSGKVMFIRVEGGEE